MKIEETNLEEIQLLSASASKADRAEVYHHNPKHKVNWYGLRTPEGELIGCAGLMELNYVAARMRGWFVRDGFRRSGNGTLLLDFIIAKAKERGFLILDANTHYVELFESRGFISTRKFKTRNTMKKDLR